MELTEMRLQGDTLALASGGLFPLRWASMRIRHKRLPDAANRTTSGRKPTDQTDRGYLTRPPPCDTRPLPPKMTHHEVPRARGTATRAEGGPPNARTKKKIGQKFKSHTQPATDG
jgi:hypothetical protein